VRTLLSALCLLLALPVLGVLGAWLALDASAVATLSHQASTVLPGYVLQTAALAMGVGLGVMLLGTASAAAVSLFDFPGRRIFEWALLLPLAMPAYVLAYAWTDALQYSSPLQAALRRLLDMQGPLWPDVRSLWGAVILFVLCLYPYVYLLTRTALAERGVQMMEAARLLGAPLRRRVLQVALPLARPAIAAGVALALMETLADYGVGAYFGLNTFSTGIYKAWLVMNDPMAAAQLASMLLLAVAVLLAAERRAQRRLRFAAGRTAHSNEARPVRLLGKPAAAAWLLCMLPVALGFVLPVAWLLRMLWVEAGSSDIGVPWSRFAEWSLTSLRLAGFAGQLPDQLSASRQQVFVTRSLQPLWEGLVRHQWASPQLASFQAELAGFDLLRAHTNAIRRVVAAHIALWQEMPGQPWHSLPTSTGSYIRNPGSEWQPSGWWLDRCIQLHEVGARALQRVDAAVGRVRLQAEWYDDRDLPLNYETEQLLHQYHWNGAHPGLVSFAQTAVNQGILACALERWRLDHGNYPETLEQLVPAYLDRIPHDLVRGRPMIYQRLEDDRFILRGVGPNEADDRRLKTSDDWLWAFPTNAPPKTVAPPKQGATP